MSKEREQFENFLQWFLDNESKIEGDPEVKDYVNMYLLKSKLSRLSSVEEGKKTDDEIGGGNPIPNHSENWIFNSLDHDYERRTSTPIQEETPSEGDCLSEELRAKHNISLGVQHIFDSGVNEIRVQGLIDLSVNQALSKERERMIEVAAKRFGYRNALELKKDLTNKK